VKTPAKIAFALLAGLAAAPHLSAQAVPLTAAVKPETLNEDVAVKLSPFEVTAIKDTGYQATETLAGTRIRTDLRDVGAAISVVTKEFLRDIGATDNSTLLQYTTSAEVAGTRSTYAGLGNGTSVDESGTLRAPSGANRVRGLSAADNTRDFFVTDIPTDFYNVERVDIQRGPNSILFGLGKPAGIINATTRNAEFRDSGSMEARFGSYGSTRGILDINQQLIPKVLAIRVDGLWNEEKYRQKPAFQNDKRLYGAVRFDPQLVKDRSFRTSLRLKFEHGDIDANRPRTVTPNDNISAWFRPTAVSASNPLGGMSKLIIANGYDAERGDTANIVAGDGRGLTQLASPNYNPWVTGQGNQQQPFWYIDGTTNQLYRVYAGFINPGARNADGTTRAASAGLVGRRFSGVFYGVGGLPTYATNARLPGYQYGQYRQQSLLDPSVFDYNNTLIDGNTKSEFEKWNTFNITLAQTAWNDRVGLEVNYDRQKYKRGGEAFLGGSPTITLDILSAFQDLNGNPNVGRPYVSGPGSGNSYQSDRQYVRGSLFAELRASDVLRSEFLVKLLGRHRINGVYSGEEYRTENLAWRQYGSSKAWDDYWNGNNANSSAIGDRPPLAFVYLGSPLLSRNSAAGSNIPGITANVALQDSAVYQFNSTWTNFGTAYNAPWTVPNNLLTAFDPATAVTQSSNPANYVGWNSNFNMNLLRYNNGADNSLLTTAQKSLRKSDSYAGSWQSYLWKDAFVVTFGWRYDQVKGKDVTAPGVPSNRGILNLNPDIYTLPGTSPVSQVFKDHSTSGGIVAHLNRILPRDPLPVNLSLSYNESSNFEIAGTRRDIYGHTIGNPTGKTRDYGVLLATKDNKFSLRVIKFESSVQSANSQLSGASGLGNIIQQGLRWRNVFKYDLGVYTLDTAGQNPNRSRYRPDTTIGETQVDADRRQAATIAAWDAIQAKLAPTGFFESWGFDPTQVYAYVATAPQGFTVTTDTKSKGYEFELTANPKPNWRVAFNASETEATRNNVGGAVLDEYIKYIDAQMAGAAGDMRQFDGGAQATTTAIQWNGFRGNYTLMKLQEGAAAPEIRKWRYNFVTNYTFKNEGILKGLGLGGSYRWQDKVIIGYPVVAVTATQSSFDLTKPYYGPSENAVDLWTSYERRINKKITWKIQLNVRNAFAKDGLIPISVEPDGQTWATVRVKPNREWFVTNTVFF
jgi:hypothetical protein